MRTKCAVLSAALAAALLLAACAAPSADEPAGTRWDGCRADVVSVRLWSDGRELTADDRETVDALLNVVESISFVRGSDADANAPGAQHTVVTLVYRDGTEEKITFPVWVRDGAAYDAGAASVMRFAAFFPAEPE